MTPGYRSRSDDAARAARLEEVSGKLAEAVAELVTSQDWIQAMRTQSRFRSRSFSNTLLIWKQHVMMFEAGRVEAPEPTYVAGYRQWQALGRQVDKGQHGYAIFAPVTRRHVRDEGAQGGIGRQLGRGEKPGTGEAVVTRMVGAKVTHVWDVSQTSGEPLPIPPAPVLLEGRAPDGMIPALIAAIQDRGFSYEDAPDAAVLDGANGLTNYRRRLVMVRADMDEAARAKTLAHELGHVVMHSPDVRPDGHCRGIGEVEAESVALMICDAAGLDSVSYTVPYVSGWSRDVPDADPADVVRATGERVRKAAGEILAGLDLPLRPDGALSPDRSRPAQPAQMADPGGMEPVMAEPVSAGVRGPGL